MCLLKAILLLRQQPHDASNTWHPRQQFFRDTYNSRPLQNTSKTVFFKANSQFFTHTLQRTHVVSKASNRPTHSTPKCLKFQRSFTSQRVPRDSGYPFFGLLHSTLSPTGQERSCMQLMSKTPKCFAAMKIQVEFCIFIPTLTVIQLIHSHLFHRSY